MFPRTAPGVYNVSAIYYNSQKHRVTIRYVHRIFSALSRSSGLHTTSSISPGNSIIAGLCANNYFSTNYITFYVRFIMKYG